MLLDVLFKKKFNWLLGTWPRRQSDVGGARESSVDGDWTEKPIHLGYIMKKNTHQNINPAPFCKPRTISSLMDSLEDEQSDCPVNSGNDIEPNELVEQIYKDSK